MFEAPDVRDLDITTCSDALVASVTTQRRQEATRWAMVAHWADLHPPTDTAGRWGADTPGRLPGDPADPTPGDPGDPGGRLRRHRPDAKSGRRGITLGAEGTPRVSEFAITELGVLLGIGTITAANLLRDILELRHRLPAVWQQVQAGHIEGWRARKAAALTRPLTLPQARAIAEQVATALSALPFARALTVIEAAVVAADPAAHHARLRDRATRRYVTTNRPEGLTELRTLIMHGTRAEVARVQTMIDQLATALALLGDPDSLDSRRVKALVLMADPARACLTLARAYPPPTTRTDPDTPDPDPDIEPDPDPADEAEEQPVPDPAEEEEAEAKAGADELEEPDLEPDPDIEHGPAEPEVFDPGLNSEPEEHPAPEPEPEEDEEELSPRALAVLFGRLLANGGTRTLDRLRPRTVLYLHLAQETLHNAVHGLDHPDDPVGVARVDELGPATLAELRTWLGHDHLTVRPVLDVTTMTPVDAYEVPAAMREAMHQREPFSVFPYATTPAPRADLDHTIPYTPPEDGGPPGQTRPGNLGPLSRHHHRAKTHGGFTCHRPLPGLYLWRTPSGHWYRRDHTGDHPLGRQTPRIINQQQPPASTLEYAFLNILLEVG